MIQSQTEPTKGRTQSVRRAARSQAGVSMLELLVVVAIGTALAGAAVFSATKYKDAYGTDDQQMRVMDLMRDASNRALVQRQTMRLELDATDNVLRLIDENGAGTTDDLVVRLERLASSELVRMTRLTVGDNMPPSGITAPPAPANYNPAVFALSTHPLSTGKRVCVLRFRLDGAVVNTIGEVTSATIYIWEPDKNLGANIPKEKKRVRAVTIFGGTGVMRLWKHDGAVFSPRL